MNPSPPPPAPAPEPTLWQRSTTRRFLRWLFSRRTLQRLLFFVVAFATIYALASGIYSWRARRAWTHYKNELAAQGDPIDWKRLIPPPVPDDQNFAMTPFLAPLFDFKPNPQPGESRWRDTNAFNRTVQFANNLPSYPNDRDSWLNGARFNFSDWLHLRFKGQTNVAPDLLAATNRLTDRPTAARAVLATLKDLDPVLDELRRASARPYARFNVFYEEENPGGILLPHLGVVKRMCYALHVRALAALALGQTDAAFEDLKLLITLAESVKGESILVSQLVRVASLHKGNAVLWEGLADHRWSEAQLQALQIRFEAVDLLAGYDRAMHAERWSGCRIIELVGSRSLKATALGETAGGLVLGGSIPSDWPFQWAANCLLWLVPRGLFDWEALNYARAFEEFFLPVVKVSSHQIDPALSERAQKQVEEQVQSGTFFQHRFFCRMLLPALSVSSRRFGLGQSRVDQAALVCALERYRLGQSRYPDQLEALQPQWIAKVPRDVVSGQPLKYRRAGDQFVLYSIGWNQEDDGGAIAFHPNHTQIDLTQGDWVWPAVRKP
jgi:hypothetical protein